MPYIKRARLTKGEKVAFEESFENMMKLFPQMSSEDKDKARENFLLTTKVAKSAFSNAFGVHLPPNTMVEIPTTETAWGWVKTTGKKWDYSKKT